MSVFEDIKARMTIDQYIGRYVELKKSGHNFKACCPFHTEETPSFYVDSLRGTWHCFGACDEGGDLFDFALKYHGWDLPAALEKFAEELHLDLPKRTLEEKFTLHYEYMLNFAESYAKMLSGSQVAMMYLTHRGINERTIIEYQIGFCPNGVGRSVIRRFKMRSEVVKALGLYSDSGFEYMSGRLVIPIRDQKGRICAFAGRTIADEDIKYINTAESPIFHKSQTLFNLDKAQYAMRKQMQGVIVEGYMDVLQCVQQGIPYVVGQMGSALTDAQFDRLKFVPQLIVATDGDKAGTASADRSCNTGIARGIDLRVALMPEGEDPDSLLRKTPDEFRTRLAHPVLAEDFLIQRILARLPEGASVQEREREAREFVKLVAHSQNPIQQNWYVQKLALGLRLPEKSLIDLLRPAKDALKSQPLQPPAYSSRRLAPDDTTEDESLLVWTLIQTPMEYYNLCRVFNSFSIPVLTVQDFRTPTARNAFRLFLEAVEQDDEEVIGFVSGRLPSELIPAQMPVDVSFDTLVFIAKAVRMSAIDQQIDYGQANIATLIQQRAKILAIS